MTDLEAVSEAVVPRPERLASRFARRIHPTWSLVLAGVLYFAFVANTVGVLPLLAVQAAFEPGEVPGWSRWLALLWYPVGQVVAWWVFARWVRARRADAFTLVRDGEIVTGNITPYHGLRGSRGYKVAVRGVVLTPVIDFSTAQRCKVLFLAGARCCLVFAPDGSAYTCRTRGGSPLGPLVKESNIDPLPEARVVE